MTDFRNMQLIRLSACSVILFVTSVVTAESTVNRPAEGEAVAARDADPLHVIVDEAVSRTRRRFLDANQHTPWQIVHGLLALRNEFELNQNGRRVNAIEYLSNEARYGGEYWFEATPYGGRAHPFTIPYAFEGHVNQTLALLSMSGLPLNHEFRVRGGRVVTMEDMVRHARMTVNTNEETTWTLWFLTHYVNQDEEWLNQNREPWSMERLVSLQVRSDVTKAPCGGTHQLFALAFARNAHLKQVGPLRGAWIEADQKVRRYVASTRSLQNSDGSFSAAFYKGRELSNDFNERIKSSGHILEWLMMALPDSDLDETWVRRGVESVSRDLINNSHQPADCGPLFHALHSLVLYKQRVAPPETPSTPQMLELVEADPVMPADDAEPAITIEDEGVARTQTVARPTGVPLPLVDLRSNDNDEDSRAVPILPPPPPMKVEHEPADVADVAAAPETATDSAPEVLDDDVPPLPPRRPLRTATSESETTTR